MPTETRASNGFEGRRPAGTEGRWASDTLSFEIDLNDPPERFELLTPANNSVINNIAAVTFGWEEADDPEGGDVSYVVWLNPDGAGWDNRVEVDAGFNTEVTTDVLRDNTSYWWKVLATDDVGLTVFSENTFFLETDRPDPPRAFSLLSPADEELFSYEEAMELTFTWEETTDPDPDDDITYSLYLEAETGETYMQYGITGTEVTVAVPDSLGLGSNADVDWFIYAVKEHYHPKLGLVPSGSLNVWIG